MPQDPISLLMLFSLLGQAARKALLSVFGDQLKSSEPSNSLPPVVVSYGNEFAMEFLSLVVNTLGSSKEDKIDAVLAAVEFLRQGPLQRALIQLADAERVEIHSEDEQNYRLERYRQALVSLDEAESVAKSHELVHVLMLRAIVKACLPGGRQSSRLDAERVQDLLAGYRTEIDTKIRLNEIRLAEHESRLSRLPKPEKWLMGGGLVGWGSVEKSIEREAYEMKIRKRKSYGGELSRILEDIQSLEEAMRALISHSFPKSTELGVAPNSVAPADA